MPITPGRPHDPTIHPRTRPEAEEFATKARATNDWFRHDGKNVEQTPSPPSRLASRNAQDIAERSKGEPDAWYQHNPKNPSDPKPKGRTHTEESQNYHDKIYGKEESWYKHDDNQNVLTPRPKSRNTSAAAQENQRNSSKADPNDWYRHSHSQQQQEGSNGDVQANKHRTPTKNASDNEKKTRPQGTPGWYYHDGASNNGSVSSPDEGNAYAPHSNLTVPQAEEYMDRNRHGSASDWYGHNTQVEPQICHSPRMASQEGSDIAKRLQGESGNWFSHDANKGYHDPTPAARCPSPSGRDLMDKARGQSMQSILMREPTANGDSQAQARVKPEAQAYAQKSIQGMMDKYLNQDVNQGYNSERPAGRSVKPEAQENAQKNKGVMDDCMGGYAGAPGDHSKSRVKPEAQEYADRNKGSVNQLMDNYGNLPGSARRHPRVKAEAESYADRNAGTMGDLMTNYGNMQVSEKPVPRLKSEAARQAAEKNKGTLGSSMGMYS